MSNQLNFFTAVNYKSPSFGNSILEKVDNYFYLGGKKAYVLPRLSKDGRERVVLSDYHSSLLLRMAKVLTYLTVVIPLVMLTVKAVLRITHNYKVLNLKEKLGKRLTIEDSTIAKVTDLVPKILQVQEIDDIKWLSNGHNLVFKIAGNPQFVFKIDRSGNLSSVNSRFNQMIKAKEVCMTHELGQLIIPQAKLITIHDKGRKYTLIAERSLDLDPTLSVQEELFFNLDSQSNEMVRQLATFISYTGFNDVTPRNIPILNETPNYSGPRRIALIDLEHMQDKVNGFIGDFNGSCGLIECLPSEEQMDIAIKEAQKNGVKLLKEQIHRTKNHRLQEIEAYKGVQVYYQRKGIVTGKEPLQIDLNSLGLDLAESVPDVRMFIEDSSGEYAVGNQTVTLKMVVKDLVNEIEKSIRESSDQDTIMGKRRILINDNDHPFSIYRYLPRDFYPLTREDEKNLWLPHILQALVDKKHIFSFTKSPYGFVIQA